MLKPLILILCTGNSCRSHLAEGILSQALGEDFEVASAGSQPAGYVHPMAIEVMLEIGLDIRSHTSKHLEQFLNQNVETIITVCGNAEQACPIFPGQVNRHHFPFEDPAKVVGSEEEQRIFFRMIRDQVQGVFQAYACGRLDQKRGRAD